jgi:hypothetical protein
MHRVSHVQNATPCLGIWRWQVVRRGVIQLPIIKLKRATPVQNATQAAVINNTAHIRYCVRRGRHYARRIIMLHIHGASGTLYIILL